MTRHNLSTDGAWVELRDPSDLRAKDRKKITAAMFGGVHLGETGELDTLNLGAAYGGTLAASSVAAAALITGWYIPYLPDSASALPRDRTDLLDELLVADDDALNVLVAPAVTLMIGTTRKADPGDFDRPNSPTGPASA